MRRKFALVWLFCTSIFIYGQNLLLIPDTISGTIFNLNVLDKKTLLVLSESNKNVYLSARNLGNTKVVSASNINTYDVLNAQNLILSVGSLTEIEKLFN